MKIGILKKLNNNCFGIDINNQHEKKLEQDIIYFVFLQTFKKKD